MDVTTISDDSTEPGGVANSVYAGSPDPAGFDRWDSDSPDVKSNDTAAFAAALAKSQSLAQQYQSSAQSIWDSGNGNIPTLPTLESDDI